MRVMKFGGTSVQNEDAIRRLRDIVLSVPASEPKLVIVSALSKVTDQLIELCRLVENSSDWLATWTQLNERHLQVAAQLQIPQASVDKLTEFLKNLRGLCQAMEQLGEVSLRSRDLVVAHGEILSSVIVHGAIVQKVPACQWIDSREFVRTDSGFGSAKVQFLETNKIIGRELLPKLQAAGVMVGQGFIGSDSHRLTTTLGRGGSDYSASIFGAALGVKRIEIWTDVDGILTTDPRIEPKAFRLRKLSHTEAAELAYFGAKVLHPATILPAIQEKIPVLVLNSKNPTCEGTEIQYERLNYVGVVKAIACKRNVQSLNINSNKMIGAHGFLRDVFQILAAHEVSVDLIATSEANVSLTLDPSTDLRARDRAVQELGALGTVSLKENSGIVSIVGDGILTTQGLGARIFQALRGMNVRMISMGASDLNMGLVVDGQDVDTAVRALHAEFFQGPLDSNLFTVNT
ncbi:MAG: lysine-sensitive aspartokinase 3 [Bdellovibrionales bacterium]|nr:lysine-sensitive aspartokinase 3 [Bdellovibrionales bacterium]